MQRRKFSSSLNRQSTSCTTVAAANHNDCNQVTAVPPCPLSIRLIAVLSGARLLETCLSNHRCCHCATLVPPPPLVCHRLCFADSLSRCLYLLPCYCAPLVQLIVVLPGGLPPPLSWHLCLSSCLPIHWLSRRVASNCLVPWPTPPFHHASASRCTPLIRLVVRSCCLAPRPLSPPGALASHHAAASCCTVVPPC
jgi:hypothetical protein